MLGMWFGQLWSEKAYACPYRGKSQIIAANVMTDESYLRLLYEVFRGQWSCQLSKNTQMLILRIVIS